jgi:hypothetical protein
MTEPELEALLPTESEWRCETCGSGYAEYVNGCPHCWEVGIRSKVLCTTNAS